MFTVCFIEKVGKDLKEWRKQPYSYPGAECFHRSSSRCKALRRIVFSKFKDQQRGRCGWSRVNEWVGSKRKFQRTN